MVVTLCAVQFVDVMGVTVVVTTLPRMVADLGGGRAGGTAVVTAYAMAFGGLLLLASRVGDRYGHRRVLIWSIAGFCVASVVAGLAGSIWILAMARAAQGTAAAVSVPAALRLLTSVVPAGPSRQRGVAAWSAAGAAAGAAGFVMGGTLTEWASWRAVFAVMVVMGLGLLCATVAFVPTTDRRDEGLQVVPWGAGLTAAVALAALVVGTALVAEEAHLVLGLAVLAGAVPAVSAFWVLEHRGPVRLVPLAARVSPRVRWGAAASCANTATTSSSITLATFYLQRELGLSPVRAAGALLPLSLVVVAAAALAPTLIRRLGWARVTATGLAVIAAGNLTLALSPTTVGIGVASAVCGLGLGIASVTANDMGTAVTTSAKSAAAGLLNTAAQSGTAIGTAAALLLAAVTDTRATWLLISLLAVGVAIAAVSTGPTGGMSAGAPGAPD